MRKILRLIGTATFALTLAAQDTHPTPTCNKCSATYIGGDEIQAYLNRAPARIANSVADQQVRAVDAGKTNADIGVVYRSGTQSEGSAVAEHDRVAIRNGATYQLKPGDVIIIPAGAGHWFTRIDDHIRYVMIRIDPDKVTPLKDEAASQADLRRDGK